MEYKVKLTNYAIDQMREIVSYISKVLLSPETALGWSDYVKSQIASLRFQPSRYVLVENEPWHSKGVHKMTVKNFIVYYWIDKADLTVWVTGIIYEKRNQLEALKKMP